jgi:hypothetical protein
MTQFNQGAIVAPYSGASLVTYLGNLTGAVVTSHYAEAPPNGAAKGLLWTQKVGDEMHIKLFDGSTHKSALIQRFEAGDDLPGQNIGPIWHDDFQSIMTWQVFDQNGANYTG